MAISFTNAERALKILLLAVSIIYTVLKIIEMKTKKMKLTSNFNKSEFDSKDGFDMPDDVLENIKVVAEQLQVLRDTLNMPITVNSAYRSVAHNKKIRWGKKQPTHNWQSS